MKETALKLDVNGFNLMELTDETSIVVARVFMTDTGRRVDGRTGGREDGRTGGREDGRTGRREDGRTGGREDGRTGGREDGRAERQENKETGKQEDRKTREQEGRKIGEQEYRRIGEQKNGRTGRRKDGNTAVHVKGRRIGLPSTKRRRKAVVDSRGFPRTTSNTSDKLEKGIDKLNKDKSRQHANKTVYEDPRRPRSPRKPAFSILDDSIVKTIRRQGLNTEVPYTKTTIKTFPSAIIDQMKSYIKPTIEDKPEGILLVCGVPEVTANKLIELASEAKNSVRNVGVSSIIKRGDSYELEIKRREVNDLVKAGLSRSKMSFIEHENIENRHLDQWGLHLNYQGNSILARNLINF
eukprot:gene17530-9155_t